MPKKPTPLPPEVKRQIEFMVRGDPETGKKLDVIQAGRAAGMAPHRARAWAHHPNFLPALIAARKQFRLELAASDELTLQAIRDGSRNDMARIAAVKQIEEMNANAGGARQSSDTPSSPFVIQIVNRVNNQPETAVTIEHPIMPTVPHAYPTRAPVPPSEPLPYVPDEPVFEPDPEPIFRMRKPWE